jgi:Cytochrome c biogenesis protein
MVLGEISTSFVLGLATPLTALCVIPLYPGFISYLSRQLDTDTDQRTYLLFGLLVAAGVVSFMLVLGVVFSTLLQQSLTSVIEVVSPVAFSLLGLMGVAMMLDLDFERYIPSKETPEFENPLVNAYAFGFFFGAIIIPCNPAFVATFFARAFLFETPVTSLLNFSSFGFGIGFPLIAFSVLSQTKSQQVIGFLQRHSSVIHRGSGAVMTAISLYYLINVFNVIPI